jgi:hypothetical protein
MAAVVSAAISAFEMVHGGEDEQAVFEIVVFRG